MFKMDSEWTNKVQKAKDPTYATCSTTVQT